MTDERIEKWAGLLAGYCLDVKPGETILVASEVRAKSLVEATCRAVVERGGFALPRLELPAVTEFFVNSANDEQLDTIPPALLAEAEHIDGRVRISAEADPKGMSTVDPRRQARLERARDPLRRVLMKKKWVLTQFPTSGYAAQARLSMVEYEAFLASSMFLDAQDPAEEWRELGRRQQRLVEFFSKVSEIRIEAPGTDLTLKVGGRKWMNSDGKRNMPSGEIYTGPIEDSAEGTLRCAFPVCRGGREVAGIELEFRGGTVVRSKADGGDEYLTSMLNLDKGSRRVGELGIGLNEGIQQFTGSILYDEKIGGTVHVALGMAYPETGGTNESALHWDLIVDLRAGGRLTADGQVVQENGRWREL